MGAGEVAAINCVDAFFGQRPGYTLGLPLTLGIEFNVRMALQAHAGIPGGFSVADGNNARGVHGRAWLGRFSG